MVEKTFGFYVSPSQLELSLAQTTFAAGESASALLTNAGGVGAGYEYAIELAGPGLSVSTDKDVYVSANGVSEPITAHYRVDAGSGSAALEDATIDLKIARTYAAARVAARPPQFHEGGESFIALGEVADEDTGFLHNPDMRLITNLTPATTSTIKIENQHSTFDSQSARSASTRKRGYAKSYRYVKINPVRLVPASGRDALAKGASICPNIGNRG